ncbi:MAG: DUF1330 domain-containing protein [Pseudomonadota bacterium]
MPVYLIAQLNIHDRPTYDKYVSAFMDVFRPYGGKVLSTEEAPEVLEGACGHSRTILLEFPSAEKAHAWYASADYQAIVKDRHAATTGNIVLIRGR